jgi:hypothetical protein
VDLVVGGVGPEAQDDPFGGHRGEFHGAEGGGAGADG